MSHLYLARHRVRKLISVAMSFSLYFVMLPAASSRSWGLLQLPRAAIIAATYESSLATTSMCTSVRSARRVASSWVSAS